MAFFTPEDAGSGQFGICSHCNLPPAKEGHDGCLGTLPEDVVMNACCGHGRAEQAYVQYWDGSAVRGAEAIKVLYELVQLRQQNLNAHCAGN